MNKRKTSLRRASRNPAIDERLRISCDALALGGRSRARAGAAAREDAAASNFSSSMSCTIARYCANAPARAPTAAAAGSIFADSDSP